MREQRDRIQPLIVVLYRHTPYGRSTHVPVTIVSLTLTTAASADVQFMFIQCVHVF